MTSWPKVLSAAATAAPDRSDTSRSALGPPSNTVILRLLSITLPITCHSSQTTVTTVNSDFEINFPAQHLHFGLQLNATFRQCPPPNLGNEIQDISCSRSSVVNDEIPVFG